MTAPVLGIDLGTTNTVVAVCNRDGTRVIADAEGETLTPSIVAFRPDSDVLVGRAARERRLIDAASTVFSVKRLIGRPFRTPEVRRAAERSPYQLIESGNGGVEIAVRGERYSLPEVSALVLRRARTVAEDSLSQICSHAVLTVPASFGELQRTATRDAGRIAGLHVLRILNEPTAAALAYGFGARTDQRVAVYDLGGGTFDLSILDLSGDVIEVIATAGDSYLGGDDIDALIADRMVEEFLRRTRIDLGADPQSYERLRVAAEWLKCQLSSTDRAHVRVEQIAQGPHGKSLDLEHTLTRPELDQLLFPMIGRTFDICESAMKVAGIRPTQIDEVILVGGQTYAPKVRSMVKEYFGREPLASVNPSHVVAEGAAILGYTLAGGVPAQRVRASGSAAARARPHLAPPSVHTLIPPPPEATPSLPVTRTIPSAPPPPALAAKSQAPSLAPGAPSAMRTLPTAIAPPAKSPLPEPPPPASLGSSLPLAGPPQPIDIRAAFGELDDEPTRVAMRDSVPPPADTDRTRVEPAPTLASTVVAPHPVAPGSAQSKSSRAPTAPTAPTAPISAPSASKSASVAAKPSKSERVPPPAVSVSAKPSPAPPVSHHQPPPAAQSVKPAARMSPVPPAAQAPAAAVIASVPLVSRSSPPPPQPVFPTMEIPPSPPVPARRSTPLPPEPAPATLIGMPLPPRVSPVPAAPSPRLSPVPAAPAPEVPAALPATPPQPPVPVVTSSASASSKPPAETSSEPPPRVPLLLDVTPHTLAVETAGGFCEPIIERNAPIPTEQTRRFSTSQDNQVSVRMRVCQGERRRVEDNQLLGTLELAELPAAARGKVKIEVTFLIDADGTLSVRARDKESGKAQRIRVALLGGLREEEVTRMYKRQASMSVRG